MSKVYIRITKTDLKGQYWKEPGKGQSLDIKEAFIYDSAHLPGTAQAGIQDGGLEMVPVTGDKCKEIPMPVMARTKKETTIGINTNLKVAYNIDTVQCDRFLKGGGYMMETLLLPYMDDYGNNKMVNQQCLTFTRDGLKQYLSARHAISMGYIYER